MRDSQGSRFFYTLATVKDVKFIETILRYFAQHGRHDLEWRTHISPYRILVSEIMLQQTQVPRVREKFRLFLRLFPSFRALAIASQADVLRAWQGLGYNRRALALYRCAQFVTRNYHGRLPRDYESLLRLPGIGPYTAGAIMAFAFDDKVPLIETNIRRVYLHHYFPGSASVPDNELMPLVTRHLEHVTSARQWYGALMDYGTYLTQAMPNANRRSKHYVRQAVFEGSFRQLRGRIVKMLAGHKKVKLETLLIEMADDRTHEVLQRLHQEGILALTKKTAMLAS